MTDVRSLISSYIAKFKGTDDLHQICRGFNSSWLNSFDKVLVERVNIELDCVRNERIYGDGEYSEMVIQDFIASLEKLLE
jgi:hypothetical protein